MAEPSNYHEIPEPSRAEAAKIRGARSMVPVADIAAKWRPRSGANLEPYIATLARVANRLIDRETGDAYSVADLVQVVLAAVLEEGIGGGTEITETGTGSLTLTIGSNTYYLKAFTSDPDAA